MRHPSTRSLCVPTGHEPRPLPLPVLSACLPTGLGDGRRVTEVHQGCGRNRGPGGEEGRPAGCGRCPWSCSGGRAQAGGRGLGGRGWEGVPGLSGAPGRSQWGAGSTAWSGLLPGARDGTPARGHVPTDPAHNPRRSFQVRLLLAREPSPRAQPSLCHPRACRKHPLGPTTEGPEGSPDTVWGDGLWPRGPRFFWGPQSPAQPGRGRRLQRVRATGLAALLCLRHAVRL